jgi:hypothetical protein
MEDLLRKVLHHKRHKMPDIAQSVDCGVDALDAFSRGQGALSSDVLTALTRELLHGVYDHVNDKIMLTGGIETNRTERFH